MVRVVYAFPWRLVVVSLWALVTLVEKNVSRVPDQPDASVVRFMSFEEAETSLRLYATSELPGSNIRNALQWNDWIRSQDAEVRSRIDKGVEDSIGNFVLYGTTFTKLPRLQSSDAALDAEGAATPVARARVHALVLALQSPQRSDRLQSIHTYLARKEIRANQTESFLTTNLLRFAREQQDYQKKLEV